MKWTQQTASNALRKYTASLAFKAAPAHSACITSACKTPVTVRRLQIQHMRHNRLL
jgi:hypothetical protein